MAEPATGLERAFDTAYSPAPSSPISSAEQRGGQSPDPATDLASVMRLGSIKQDAGNFAEAEECFRRALEIGEHTLGPENPDLIILLNDLTRLYLRQSAYGSAEPLLLRLLELKRSKGDDHPEVATVLASLATVRQALGMHESSEQLWRRVLDIRERTLAPNHFATASALEHLGDACAARGKIREALSAFQRALTIREKTLGNEHPSMRVARERIADLQLQASDDLLDPTSGPETGAERYRLVSGGAIADSAPNRYSPPVIPSTTPQIRVTAHLTGNGPLADTKPQRDKKPSLMIPRGYTPPAAPAIDIETDDDRAENVVMALPSIEPSTKGEEENSLKTATVAYRDALESVREEFEDSLGHDTIADRTGKVFAAIVAFLGKRQVVAAITILVLSLLGVAVATDKHAFGESGLTASEQTTSAAAGALVPRASAQPVPVPVNNVSVRTADNNVAKSSKPRAAEERSSSTKKLPEKKPEQPTRVAMPLLSSAVLSRLDSVAAKAASVGNRAGDAFNVQQPIGTVSQKRATFSDDQSLAPQRARLLGELPTPTVPPQVMDVEGEVRVRFNVDTLGRPMIETFAVVSSPNPLLTAAVRKVIPGMRFEPARTGGPDAKPIGDVVQIGFQFARSR